MQKNINKFSDEELRKLILELLKQNGVNEMYGSSPKEMADYFLSYTKLGRQVILDWYGGLEKTKNTMNWIEKTGFEHKYFYIGGIEAVVALLLLGYKVNSDRYANITKKSMSNLNEYGLNYTPTGFNFFERYKLSSSDINKNWDELVRKNMKK